MSLSVKNPKSLSRTLYNFYDDEWLSWTPETTEFVLRNEFDYDMDKVDIDAVEALKATLRSNEVIKEAILFEKVVLAFNGEPLSFEVWEGVTPYELAIGVAHIAKMIGQDVLERDMSRSVKAYMASVLVSDDVHVAPKELNLDMAEAEVRTLSEVKKPIREQIKDSFSTIMDGPTEDISKRLAQEASENYENSFLLLQDGGKGTQEEQQFVREQLGRLTAIALKLDKESLL